MSAREFSSYRKKTVRNVLNDQQALWLAASTKPDRITDRITDQIKDRITDRSTAKKKFQRKKKLNR